MQHLAGVVQGRGRDRCMNYYRPLSGQWKGLDASIILCMVAHKRTSRCSSRDRSAFQIVRIHDMPRLLVSYMPNTSSLKGKKGNGEKRS